MNEEKFNPDDARLSSLLREARPPTPPLPPRFQEQVWRRIEIPGRSGALNWAEVLLARILRPRFALAVVAVLVLAGALLGAREGAQTARQDAQARYLEAVGRPLH